MARGYNFKLDVYIKFANKEYQENGNSVYFQSICDKIIKGENPTDNYIFATSVKGINAKKHGEIVIIKGDEYLNFLYATEVQGADIDAHRAVIEKSNNKKLLEKFDREFTDIHDL